MNAEIAPEALPFVSVPNAFSSAELDEIVRLGDRQVAGKATLQGVPQAAQYEQIRVTETAWLVPDEENRWLYVKMAEIVKALNERFFKFELKGFSDPFQYTIYRAAEGGHYDWHADHGTAGPARRKLSLSVQLTDPASYEGCDLEARVGKMPCSAGRERGNVIAFPSYVLHRVTPITAGTRKSLVAWAVGPRFR